MSYVSGFMLGASIGKAVHKYLGGNGKSASAVSRRDVNERKSTPLYRMRAIPDFACVSALPGRRRYRAKAIMRNAPLAELLQEGLKDVKGLTSVEVNRMTGSILVRAESDDAFKRLEIFLESRFFFCPCTGAPVTACADVSCYTLNRQPSSEYKHTLQEVLSSMSAYVYERTHHLFDLRSLVSFILITRGIRRMVALGEMPSGPQMLWWAVALLRGR